VGLHQLQSLDDRVGRAAVQQVEGLLEVLRDDVVVRVGGLKVELYIKAVVVVAPYAVTIGARWRTCTGVNPM
jgi:hypothetical protein